MQIKALTVGPIETNCYIVTNETTDHCVIIDPGDESNTILDYVEDNGLTCDAILVTHGHYDHIGVLETVREETGAAVYMSKMDIIDEPTVYFPLPPSTVFNPVKDGDVISEAGLSFSVMSTPGHTPGGVCYICEDVIFTGDTLFKGTCGRFDLPGGSESDILFSVKKICGLSGDFEIYPGHMEQTTLNRERLYNYYCRKAEQL